MRRSNWMTKLRLLLKLVMRFPIAILLCITEVALYNQINSLIKTMNLRDSLFGAAILLLITCVPLVVAVKEYQEQKEGIKRLISALDNR